MINLLNLLRETKYKLLKAKTTKIILKNITAIGDNHNFEPTAKVTLYFGATSANVVMNSNSELFGKIICWGTSSKVKVGEWAKIGFNCTINCVDFIEIGDYTAIADGVTIVDHNYHPSNPADRKYMRMTPHGSIERSPLFADHKPIKIGRNVMIGHNVRICKGVTIGDNSIIGANAVVTKDIPANCIAVGLPAKVVKADIDKETQPVFPLNK